MQAKQNANECYNISQTFSYFFHFLPLKNVHLINCRVQCGSGQQQKTDYEDASSTSTSVHHCKH